MKKGRKSIFFFQNTTAYRVFTWLKPAAEPGLLVDSTCLGGPRIYHYKGVYKYLAHAAFSIFQGSMLGQHNMVQYYCTAQVLARQLLFTVFPSLSPNWSELTISRHGLSHPPDRRVFRLCRLCSNNVSEATVAQLCFFRLFCPQFCMGIPQLGCVDGRALSQILLAPVRLARAQACVLATDWGTAIVAQRHPFNEMVCIQYI